MALDISFTWQFVLAVCASLIFIGHLLDFLIREAEAEKLHNLFFRWARALEQTSLRQWQIKIAQGGTKFLQIVHTVLIRYVGNFLRFEPPQARSKVPLFPIIRIIFDALFVGSFALYWFYGHWFFGTFGFPFLIVLFFSFVRIVSEMMRLKEWSRDFQDFIVTVPLISSVMSLAAILISLYAIPPSLLNTHWFLSMNDGSIIAKFPLLLPFINLPFDFLTIIITMFLLGFIIKFGRFIAIVAFLDILCSALLAVLLYSVLRTAENGWDISNYGIYLELSWKWFSDIFIWFWEFIRNKPVSIELETFPDIHLLPMLFSTFLPVTVYMSLFLILSFSKPVMLISGRIFESIGKKGKKGESVFKQFAVLLSALTAAIKAIHAYLTVV